MQVEVNEQENEQENEKFWKQVELSHRRGKIMGGLLVMSIGSLFLARELGAQFPEWILSWKTLLIGLGIVSAVKHRMRNAWWFFLIATGSAFLLNDLYPEFHLKPILWPVLLILAGLMIIFKPRRKDRDFVRKHWGRKFNHQRFGSHKQAYNTCKGSAETDKEDVIHSTAFMSGIKKNIISKNFKGGGITNVMGGTELNLMQADIETSAKLEITQVMGGTQLIIPPNWEIKSELVTVLGGMEDNRPQVSLQVGETQKILIITGTTFLGGIEISSY